MPILNLYQIALHRDTLILWIIFLAFIPLYLKICDHQEVDDKQKA